jgi:hypothetical protein
MADDATQEAWPALRYADWADTYRTLHLWTQIVGKVRLARTPWLNHSWQTPLYVSARGLTTGPIPHGRRLFDLELDFVDAKLVLRTDAEFAELPLRGGPVAGFYAAVMAMLRDAGVPVAIHAAPNEMAEATPFAEDDAPRIFEPAKARRFWRGLVQADRVLKRFRTGFIGKASPVHFFWGSFDLAATRFSGRRAPPHPGGAPHLPADVMMEAYSHEVSSAGFWPGGEACEEAIFYSYAWPEPAGFRAAKVEPSVACYDSGLGEFVLPYEAVRTAADPERALMAFLETTYAAAANAARWDRDALECGYGVAGKPRKV